MHLAASIPI